MSHSIVTALFPYLFGGLIFSALMTIYIIRRYVTRLDRQDMIVFFMVWATSMAFVFAAQIELMKAGLL